MSMRLTLAAMFASGCLLIGCSSSQSDPDRPIAIAGSEVPGSMFEYILDDKGELRKDLARDYSPIALSAVMAAGRLGVMRFHELSVKDDNWGATLGIKSVSQEMALGLIAELQNTSKVSELKLVRTSRFAPASWDMQVSIANKVYMMELDSDSNRMPDEGMTPGMRVIRPDSGTESLSVMPNLKYLFHTLSASPLNRTAWLESLELDTHGDKLHAVLSMDIDRVDQGHQAIEEYFLGVPLRIAMSTIQLENRRSPPFAKRMISISGPLSLEQLFRTHRAPDDSTSPPDNLSRNFSWSPAGASTAPPLPRDNDSERRHWNNR